MKKKVILGYNTHKKYYNTLKKFSYSILLELLKFLKEYKEK